MGKKVAESISVIGGADGPTSVFIAGKNPRNFKRQITALLNKCRRKKIEKRIVANAHTIDEVMQYISQKYGYVEVNQDDEMYQSEYCQMRASFMLQYKPDLLGESSVIPVLKEHTEEAMKKFMEQLDEHQRLVESIPSSVFNIDLHIMVLRTEDFESEFIFEKNYDYIGGSASGNSKDVKKYHKIFNDIYRYFGVSQSDIENRTRRYKELVSALLIK